VKLRHIRLRPDGKTDCFCPYTYQAKLRWCFGPRCPEWEEAAGGQTLPRLLNRAGYVVIPLSIAGIVWSVLNYLLHHLTVSVCVLLLGICLVYFIPADEPGPDRFGTCRKIAREEEAFEERGGYLKK